MSQENPERRHGSSCRARVSRTVDACTLATRLRRVAPASRPYFVLPIYDDEPALYRSIGTGMRRKRPRFRLLHLTVQTQGIVGIVTAVVAAGCGGLAASPAGSVVAWLVAALAFLVTMVTLFVYWHRSLADMRAAIRPIHPTPTDRLNVPI